MSIKEPKDLEVKVGTPEEVLWTRVKKHTELKIKESKDELIINRALLTLAIENIEIEKAKMLRK